MPAADRDEALRELGRMARDRRESANCTLEDIFERTRVRIEFLRGIEEGDYQGFPDLVYIKGFVRTYLSVINAEDLKDEFISWLNRESRKEQRLLPTNVLGDSTFPTKGFRQASRFWLFALLILILAGTGVYVWYSWENNNPFSSFPPVRASEPGGAVPGGNAASGDGTPTNMSLSRDVFLSILPPPVSAEPEPEPVKPSIVFRAVRGEAWMKVTVDDKVLFSRTLRAGSEVSWDLTAEARVVYGRTNVVEVILNGKNLGVANPRGSRASETYLYNPDGTYRKAAP
ncbi:MAG: DUF4115 domain-containing protein [Synergistaceae bacterium]|jgi:transcriptional regulator with XRE-family HTH domain|nr:DUF4115 domain-containing protein [Synergistaceae bacterium]